MTKIIFLILAFFVITAIASPQGSSDKILPYPIYRYEMANGLKVVSVPFDSPGIAAFYIIVRAGSRNETEEGVTGFAHFFEHMMFRGTKKYSKEDYDKVLKSIGASANAYTSIDQTVYHMVGNAEKLELMFEIESDRFQNLKYSEHDFKTEAGAVKGEYTKNISSPNAQLYENIRNTAFDKHTYKHTTMGFFKDIVDMPNQFAYSLKFFDRFYRPEYCTILVVGDITPDRVKFLAEKYFGNWKRGSFTSDIPSESEQKGTRYTHVKNSSVPPVLSLNFKGPAMSDNSVDSPSLDLIGNIYFSEISSLYKKLLIDENKVRRISFNTPFSRDPNLITISVTLRNSNDMQYIKDEIMKTLEYIKNNPADETSLREAISNIKYGFSMGIDTPGSIAGFLAYYIAVLENPESVNNYYSMFNKITYSDLMNTAKKYFIPEALTIGTISGDDECPVK